MTKIQIPMAVTLPNADNQPLQIIVTPEGVYGRVDTGDRGRGNRFAMYGIAGIGHSHDTKKPVVEMPATYEELVDDESDPAHGTMQPKPYEVVQTGMIEVDEDMLKAVCERGYATGEESTVVNAIRKALENRKGELHFLKATEEVGPWVDNVVKPTWSVIIPDAAPVVVVAAEPVAPVILSPVIEDVIQVDPTRVVENDGGDLALAAMAIYDNPSAYVVPTLDFEWIKGEFNDTGMDQFEFLRKARKARKNVSITGPTGCGKSTLLFALGAEDNVPVAEVAFGEATDTTALFDDVALVKGQTIRQLNNAGMVAKYGGYLGFAEVSSAGDGQLTPIYNLLDFSRTVTLSNGVQFKLHPDCQIVVTQNPVDAAHTHTSVMSAALNRRFWHVEMGYVDEIEEKLVPIEPLREIAKEIRRSDIKQPFGTDSLVQVHEAVTTWSLKAAMAGLIMMFREQSDREVVRPIVDVRLEELAAAYGQKIESDVEDISLEWGIEAPQI